ncbi:hypothetical protein X777_10622 [Ooceraea biroi]|uniref:Uncharacterized protein n=1 Tax=Ooceraea biroi TaxID=2015173 RepID=A0A026W5W4_OOCBI|nr:hypothetical protein X777_10622 [Ooceraea biroi]
MDYVKEVESEINKQNTRRVARAKGPRAKTSIQKNARAAARIGLKNGRTTKRRGWRRAGEMDESCWGLKGASERGLASRWRGPKALSLGEQVVGVVGEERPDRPVYMARRGTVYTSVSVCRCLRARARSEDGGSEG